MSENASGITGTDDVAAIQKLGETRDAIVSELRKTIVGMDDVIDEMMIAIFAQHMSTNTPERFWSRRSSKPQS